MRKLCVPVLFIMLLVAAPTFAQNGILILAPNDFVDELQPLLRFKLASGRPTWLVSLEALYQVYTGVDAPEQIKRCIADHEHNHGVRYVLLVGDADRFPVRYQYWGLTGQLNYAASDLYYADLYGAGGAFDDWDADNNGRYGEVLFAPEGNINHDGIDYWPDVAVGRIAASTGDEVATYVATVIAYETETTPHSSWFTKAYLYTGAANQDSPSDPPMANDRKDLIAGLLANKGVTSTKRYWNVPLQQPPPNMPQQAITDINSGAGFVNYIGHGDWNAWSCLGLGAGDLHALRNTGTWPIMFAAACNTGEFVYMAPYGPYIDVNGIEHPGTENGEVFTGAIPAPAPLQDDADHGTWSGGTFYAYDRGCLGEFLLSAYGAPPGSSGAIAYLGERSGGQWIAADLDQFFFEAYDWGGKEVLGDMWRFMIEQYYNVYHLSASSTWSYAPSQWIWGHVFTEPQKMIFFGDPSVVVGGAYRTTVCGTVYDGYGGPLAIGARYRATCDVTVPAATRLTVSPGASLLFAGQHKVSALDSSSVNGLVINGTAQSPAYLMSSHQWGWAGQAVRGIRINGQMRLRNGGTVRFN